MTTKGELIKALQDIDLPDSAIVRASTFFSVQEETLQLEIGAVFTAQTTTPYIRLITENVYVSTCVAIEEV